MTNKETKTKVDELKEVLKKKSEARSKAEEREEIEVTAKKEAKNSSEDIEIQIRQAEEEAKNHYDKLLRVMAEFENYKKRIVKEREEQFKFANEKLLTDMLPSIDDLDRVLDHVPLDAPEDVKKIADGVELVRKSLLQVLERYGLKEVKAQNEKFDPVHHEAIATIDSEGHEPGQVVAVHRKGYWLFDRLIRPAMVTVAKEKKEGDQ